MADPTRKQILVALKTRLQAITVANGFESNAGSTVRLADSIELGPDDPDTAIRLIPEPDVVKYLGEQARIDLPVLIAATARASVADPLLAIESLLGDIKRAVELSDRTLGGTLGRLRLERGSTEVLDREPGSTVIGVGIRYIAPYVEVWGDP